MHRVPPKPEHHFGHLVFICKPILKENLLFGGMFTYYFYHILPLNFITCFFSIF
jgi:hypothetical protein